MNKYEGGGTLRTIGWMTHNGKRSTREVVIDLDKIICVTEVNDDTKGNTCALSLTESMAMHVDVSLEQMRQILDEHKKYPHRNFDTHAVKMDEMRNIEQEEENGTIQTEGVKRAELDEQTKLREEIAKRKEEQKQAEAHLAEEAKLVAERLEAYRTERAEEIKTKPSYDIEFNDKEIQSLEKKNEKEFHSNNPYFDKDNDDEPHVDDE